MRTIPASTSRCRPELRSMPRRTAGDLHRVGGPAAAMATTPASTTAGDLDLFAHQSSFAVSGRGARLPGPGDRLSDCTGYCFGPHPRFEVRIRRPGRRPPDGVPAVAPRTYTSHAEVDLDPDDLIAVEGCGPRCCREPLPSFLAALVGRRTPRLRAFEQPHELERLEALRRRAQRALPGGVSRSIPIRWRVEGEVGREQRASSALGPRSRRRRRESRTHSMRSLSE